jgi:hypothetical protein
MMQNCIHDGAENVLPFQPVPQCRIRPLEPHVGSALHNHATLPPPPEACGHRTPCARMGRPPRNGAR